MAWHEVLPEPRQKFPKDTRGAVNLSRCRKISLTQVEEHLYQVQAVCEGFVYVLGEGSSLEMAHLFERVKATAEASS